MNKYLSTLDIDTNDKENIKKILNKIVNGCTFLQKIEIVPSCKKGFHVSLFCSIKCDICRFCYDDFRRFAYDQQRPEAFRNILFDDKTPIKDFLGT